MQRRLTVILLLLFHIIRKIWTTRQLVAGFAAEVTSQNHLPSFELGGDGQLKPWMSIRAFRPGWTKAGQIVHA